MTQPTHPGKRQLFKASAALAAAATLAACNKAAKPEQAAASSDGHSDAAQLHSQTKYDCYGKHQAGITTPHQLFGTVCAFDVSAADASQLINLLRILTARIEFLTQGGELNDPDPKLPPSGSGLLGKKVPPDGLTITVSVGASLLDGRFGLTDKKPKHLVEMTRFPNDKLLAEWCDGDLSVQICAFSPETCQNALRDLIKNTARYATTRWAFILAGRPNRKQAPSPPATCSATVTAPATPTFPTKTADAVLWTGVAENSRDEPAWATNGSYQAVRLIRQFVEFWDRTPLQEQDAIFGRENTAAHLWARKPKATTPITPPIRTAKPSPKTVICVWATRATRSL